MKTIWKYELYTTDSQTVEMPMDAEILCVQVQNGKPCLWASVETGQPKVNRIIEVYGTGNPFEPFERKYIGTYQLHGGALVFHVFEYTGL